MPPPICWLRYTYTLNARNQRTTAAEVKREAGTAVLATNFFAYGYDALGRLTAETNTFSQANLSGFYALYTYDLNGNRLTRQVTSGSQTLTTTYTYDLDDRLLVESNFVAVASPPFPRSGGSVLPLKNTGSGDANPMAYRRTPSAWLYYVIQTILYALILVFLLPALPFLVCRWRRVRALTVDLRPERALFPRCLATLLAALMALLSLDLRVLADEAALYAALSTETWGPAGSVIYYEYDANGSVRTRTTTGPRPETVTYAYNLEKRLASVTTASTNGPQVTTETTQYAYDQGGNRVHSESHTLVNGVETTGATNLFLIDPANPTGLPQVLEELPAVGATPTRSYTMGDDVISQTIHQGGSETTAFLLYDGHGSTRQLVDAAGALGRFLCV